MVLEWSAAGHRSAVHCTFVSVESGVSRPAEPRSRATIQRRGTPALPEVRPEGRTRADAEGVATSRRSSRSRSPRKGRRVTRVVRRVELWSVTKIALVFNTVMMVIAIGAVVLLWALANTTGLVEDLEGFLQESGFQDFRFDGADMFARVVFIGAVFTLASTVFAVLAAALVNLISEITGGIRFVVIEEILPAPAAARTAASPPVVPAGIATGPAPGTPGFPTVPPSAPGRAEGEVPPRRRPRPEGQRSPSRAPRPDSDPHDPETSPWLADGPFDVEAH